MLRVGQCAACLKEKRIGSKSASGGITRADIKSLGRKLNHVPHWFFAVPVRVADPVHFRPDPDPANQNFKIGSGPFWHLKGQ